MLGRANYDIPCVHTSSGKFDSYLFTNEFYKNCLTFSFSDQTTKTLIRLVSDNPVKENKIFVLYDGKMIHFPFVPIDNNSMKKSLIETCFYVEPNPSEIFTYHLGQGSQEFSTRLFPND